MEYVAIIIALASLILTVASIRPEDRPMSFSEALWKRRDRKLFAEHALKHKNNNLLFMLLDGKPIADAVWKMIKPEFERPFASYRDL